MQKLRGYIKGVEPMDLESFHVEVSVDDVEDKEKIEDSMKKFLFILSMCTLFLGLDVQAKETFAPLRPVGEVDAVLPSSAQKGATEIPVTNPLTDYKIPQELPYFGGMPPVVPNRILQGGTLLERKETKLVEGKVALLGGDIPVKVRPAFKVSSSNPLLKPGDYVDFVVIEDVIHNEKLVLKRGTNVKGLVVKLNDNDYNGKPAEIFIGQFVVSIGSREDIGLKGLANKKGESHDSAIHYASYLIGPAVFWIRGGEVQLSPKKDEYTLYIGESTTAEGL